MELERELRAYLEALELESGRGSTRRRIDEQDLHRQLIVRLRQLEDAGARDAVQRLFGHWSHQLARFARYLETVSSPLAPLDPVTAGGFACQALDVALDRAEPGLSMTEHLELKRIAQGFVGGTPLLDDYALENRLTHDVRAGSRELTELGRIFLRLRGKDAARWLLTGEVLQNVGRADRWHASHELLAEAMAKQRIAPQFLEEGEACFPYPASVLDRLGHLRVLTPVFDDPEGAVIEYVLEPAMREVVQAVIEPGPWHAAIRALLDDERARVLPVASAGAAEATIEQTKLVAHEVRNALIPVRRAIEALRPLAQEDAVRVRIDTAKQGVVRVLEFVDALVQMSELITEPLTQCEIGAVVDEAVAWVDSERRVDRRPLADAVRLQAPRARLARAISNVVGNALQATTEDQPVRVSVAREGGTVRVIVDDGGPGVPKAHRARIFLEGVTMRRDGGGSGFGLTFVRRVVEGALHGRVWCEDSDLGGARFVIEVPEASP